MATIIYQGQFFDEKYIRYADFSGIEDNYLQESLIFCRKWLQRDTSFAIQTSGSTGKPKLIYAKRSEIEASIRMSQEFFAWKGNETVLVCLHTQYIAGKMMLLRGLELGWTMYLQKPNNNPLEHFEETLDFAAFVPLQMQQIIEHSSEKLKNFSSKACIIIGGAAISKTLEKSIQSIPQPAIFQTYGMTETLSHIALRKLNGQYAQKNFIPLNHVKIRLDNRNCLCITSPTTSFQEICTNDIAQIEEDGSFRILGRADNVIISGGIKIQLEEVENEIATVFEKVQLQRRFYCVGIGDEYWGQMLVLCIEGERLPTSTEEHLWQHLRKIPQKYHIPKKILYQETFSETETGKIKRAKL